MKTIEPSAKIIEGELSALSVYQRIDHCASVCYQRPPKPTEEEAREFCSGMVNRGHFTTLEMAVVHLVVPAWGIPHPKYFSVTQLKGEKFIVSGSVRAFLEADASEELRNFLREHFPLFFGGCVNYGPAYVKGCEPVRFAEPHEIPWQHKHVAVRFIINRAVSHELVRHRPCSFLQESQRYCCYHNKDLVLIEPLGFSEWSDRQRSAFWHVCETAETQYNLLLDSRLKPQQARAVLPNSTKTEVICYASLPQWLHMFSLRCSPAADPEMRRVMIPLREEFKQKYQEAFE